MYKIDFVYGENIMKYENIQKVICFDTMDVILEGKEIMNHPYSLNCDFHLYSTDASYHITHTGLTSIIIFNQD